MCCWLKGIDYVDSQVSLNFCLAQHFFMTICLLHTVGCLWVGVLPASSSSILHIEPQDCDLGVLWVELKQILHMKDGCSDCCLVWDRDRLPYRSSQPGVCHMFENIKTVTSSGELHY